MIPSIDARQNTSGSTLCSCPLCNPNSSRISAMKSQDQKTRAHELAHLRTAGSYATSMPVYNLDTGPDGEQYANGGHVGVDLTPIAGDPQATVQKGRQLKAAALAPDDPSSQDQAVAGQAQQMIDRAQAEIASRSRFLSKVNVVA